MPLPRKEQFSGALIGFCLGDAVGFPVEGYPPTICDRYVKQILFTGLAGQWKHYPFDFGQYSDDSQLSRTLMESLKHCSAFVPEDYASRIASLFQNKGIIGQGKATQEAAQRLVSGVEWKKAGTLPPSAGNGSAMRAFPIGLHYYDDPEKLCQFSHEQSWMTHQDPRCSAGAIALAGCTALLLQAEKITPTEIIDQLCKWTTPYSEDFTEQLANLPDWLKLDTKEAFQTIYLAGIEEKPLDHWQGISPFVTSSVIWSLYSFFRNQDDYWEAVCTAIMVGGDTDTTAAMTGGLSGTWLGLNALPDHLAQKIHDQQNWNHEQLVDLAHALYDIRPHSTSSLR